MQTRDSFGLVGALAFFDQPVGVGLSAVVPRLDVILPEVFRAAVANDCGGLEPELDIAIGQPATQFKVFVNIPQRWVKTAESKEELSTDRAIHTAACKLIPRGHLCTAKGGLEIGQLVVPLFSQHALGR